MYKSPKSMLETANIITEGNSCVITEQFVGNQLGTGTAKTCSRVGVLEVLQTGKCTKKPEDADHLPAWKACRDSKHISSIVRYILAGLSETVLQNSALVQLVALVFQRKRQGKH